MSVELSEFFPLLPEIFLLTMACVILIVDVYLEEGMRSITYALSILALLGTGIITYQLAPSEAQIVLAGTFVNDPMAVVLKQFIYLLTIGVFV